ncbi:MAG: ABC transporter ATP-binding protein [Elusimicrobiota bacterium]
MNFLSVSGISFSYGKKEILKNISFSLPQKSALYVLGPNGGGKTTLLKILAGILKQKSGDYFIDGKKISELTAVKKAEKAAYVPGEINTVFDFSVIQTVMLGRIRFKEWWREFDKEDKDASYDAMKKLGIENLAEKSVNKISLGEKQLVFLAQALVQRPSVMILDEPSSHLDIDHKIKLFEALSEMKKNGITIVFASHEIKPSLFYSDYCLCLKEGELFRFCTSKEITFDILGELYSLKNKNTFKNFL